MRVTCGVDNLELSVCGSNSILLGQLQTCDQGTLILGQEFEDPSEFYALIIHHANTRHSFGVGILSPGYGLRPHILPLAEQRIVMLGFANRIAGIRTDTRMLEFQRKLDGLFYGFLHVPARGVVLAVFETGATALDPTGVQLWKHSQDIVTNWSLTGDSLDLEFLRAGSIHIHVRTGVVSC